MDKPHITFTDGWKYRLEEDYVIQTGIFPEEDIDNMYVSLTKSGLLTGKKGFCFDGPSGEIKVGFLSVDITRDSKHSMRAACGHDLKAYLMRQGLLSPTWYHQMNKEFRTDLKADGMWNWQAQAWYKVVDTVDDYIKPESKKKLYIAP